jgi:flagellin
LDDETTLSTEASNGTLTPAQEDAANLSYQSNLAEIANIGTTTDYNGSSVFANNGNGLSDQGISTSLSSTSLTSPSNAQSALGQVNQAVSGVAAEQGSYGARINATQASQAVTQTQEQNTEAALNAIDSTDYAQETSNLAQDDLQLQFGTYALAQADQLQQSLSQSLFSPPNWA